MACPSCDAVSNGQPMPPPWRNPQVVTSALSGLLLATVFLGSMFGLSSLLETIFYLLSVFIGGWYFIKEGLETLLEEHQIGIEILMAGCGCDGRTLGTMGGSGHAGVSLLYFRGCRRLYRRENPKCHSGINGAGT